LQGMPVPFVPQILSRPLPKLPIHERQEVVARLQVALPPRAKQTADDRGSLGHAMLFQVPGSARCAHLIGLLGLQVNHHRQAAGTRPPA